MSQILLLHELGQRPLGRTVLVRESRESRATPIVWRTQTFGSRCARGRVAIDLCAK